jgi:hypothetical protein
MNMITHRVSPQQARYTPAGGREKCSFCRFYIAPKWCGHVTGPVSPMGWCKYFSQEMRQQFGGGIAAGGAATFDQSFLGGTLGSGAVFTRASPGWYYNSSGVLVQAANDVPRFDYDPVTMRIKGLLLEDTSTNLILQSGNLAHAAWSPGGSAPTVTANSALAPDGTMTAARIAFQAVSSVPNFSSVAQAFTATASVYAYSVWLRGNVGGERVYISTTINTQAWFEQQATLTTAWQRFTLITGTLSAAPWYVILGVDMRDAAQAATPAQTIYAWGAQVELNFMSSYIPTTTAAVTRAADVLSYPIASVSGFSQTQGSLSHEYIMEGTPLSYNGPIAFVGTDPNSDFILPDQGDAQGTSVARTINGASINVAGTGVGAANWGPSLMVFRDVLQRGAMSWAINQNVNAAHNAIPHNFSSVGPPASLPVITNLVISGTVVYQYSMSQWARRTRYWPRQLSQAELISATQLDGPTLTLDFMQPGSLDPRIVFTRASSATYTDASGVVRTAATNAPRWDYSGGVLRGLLIEEQRTNVMAPSTNWNNVPLTTSQDGLIPNIGISPSGASDAMAMVPCVANTVHQFFAGQQSGSPNTTYTFSVYLKAAGYKFARVGLENDAYPVYQSVIFDLSNGTINSQAPNGSGKIQAMGNGWYRCSTTNTSTTGGFNYIANVVLHDDAVNIVFSGDGVKGVWAFGQQVEVGAFPTSYIPTTSVAVTRAADVVSMPTNVSWFNANFGTLHGEFIYTGQPTSGFGHVLDLVGADSNIDSIGLYVQQTANAMNGQIRNGGTNGYVNGGFIITPGTVVKSAIAYQPTVASSAGNGAVVSATALTTPLPVVTSLWFMQTPVGYQQQPTGYFRRVTYWNRALSDTEMQQVTT